MLNLRSVCSPTSIKSPLRYFIFCVIIFQHIMNLAWYFSVLWQISLIDNFVIKKNVYHNISTPIYWNRLLFRSRDANNFSLSTIFVTLLFEKKVYLKTVTNFKIICLSLNSKIKMCIYKSLVFVDSMYI